MIPLTLNDIAQATGGRLVGADALVDGPVVTDSREMGPGGLFVARVGEHEDGMRYAGAAVAAGAVGVLAANPVEAPPAADPVDTAPTAVPAAVPTVVPTAVPTVVVADVQLAFGRVARAVIDRATGPDGDLTVVAVTGSSGKTSTKDLLAAVLAEIGETVAPVNSLNGEIGVPLTVCRITPGTRFLVAEMGARGIGHIAYLTGIAPPRIAVVLNVGTAHVGEFGSIEAIAAAKAELVEALPDDGVAVLNADDPRVAAMAKRTSARVVTVGLTPDATISATDVVLDDAGRPSFTCVTPTDRHRITLPLVGGHHVGNALAVIAVALECGQPLERIAASLARVRPPSRWRMEVLQRDGVTIVNDAYNANPDSMAAALRALAAMRPGPGGRRIAVLGQMLELGEESERLHAAVGALSRDLHVDRLVGLGPGARAYAADDWFEDAAAAERYLRDMLHPGDVVLFKSSRDAGLRWLGDRLAGLEVPA